MAPTRTGPKKTGKPRGRPSGSRNSITAPRSSNDKVAKRRGRPPGSSKPVARDQKPEKPTAKEVPGRKRKSDTQVGKEGARRKSSGAKEVDQTRGATEKNTMKKKRGRPSRNANESSARDDSQRIEKSTTTKSQRRTSRSHKEQAQEEEVDELFADPPKEQQYTQLAPRTRRIAQETIDTWPHVSPQVLDQILETLQNAKNDIVHTQRDEHRRRVADDTLGSLIRTLARQLSNSRIPPQAKDIFFNIGKLNEHNDRLFRELTRERHAKQLLEEQVKVALDLVEKDEESLQQLKKNARDWKVAWKRQEKQGQLHPLLQDLESTEADGDGPDDIGLKHSSSADGAILDMPDADLAPLLKQLTRSLESLQGNHEQVAGIDPGLRNAQVALDDMLFKHASAEQYAVP